MLRVYHLSRMMIDDIVMQTAVDCVKERMCMGKAPYYAALGDILLRVREAVVEALQRLCENNKLIEHRTINGKSYELIDTE